MSRRESWLPILVLVAAGAACHTRPPAVAPARTVTPAPAPTVPARPPAPAAAARPLPAPTLTEADLFQRKSLSALNAEGPLADAFFDYDQNTLREDARRTLQQDAQWLTKWPQTKIRVDGHCDERGTPEYNLALGERRSAVVREYLVSLGVRADRIEPRSLGREAPFCRGSDEACWAQNRRGHFEIIAK